MAKRTNIKITFKGIKRALSATDSRRFEAVIRKKMRQATALNGKVGERALRKTIQKGKKHFAKNAALTIAIKKSSKPLVHYSDLFQSITSKVINDFSVFVGVNRNDRNYDVAELVHRGANIPVTQRMRNMFLLLHEVSIGEADPAILEGRPRELYDMNPGVRWLPLKPTTTHIVIPGRPWATITFKDATLQKTVQGNWNTALRSIFSEQVKGAKE